MIYILHGDDIVRSRDRLQELLKEFPSVITLDSEKVTTSDLSQVLGITDLFLTKKCVVFEKILKLPKKEMEILLGHLEKDKNLPTIFFWHNTELSKIFLSKVKKANVEVFLLPKLFFTFLDNLSPKNFLQEVKTLSQMESVEAEQVFYAMVKRVRLLLTLKTRSASDEIAKMNPWQLSKLESQSKVWDLEQLELFYNKLFETEKKIKSSGLMVKLKKHLDFLLTSGVH